MNAVWILAMELIGPLCLTGLALAAYFLSRHFIHRVKRSHKHEDSSNYR